MMFVLVVATSFMLGCVAEVGDEGAPIEGMVAQHSDEKAEGRVLRPSLEGLKLMSPPETVLAPAPGISYFQTFAVISASSSASWESVTSSQFSTVRDHGGSWIDVAVLQYGYGNGGGSLNSTSGVRYAIENLCGSFSNLHYCSAGEIVTGFLTYYEFTNSSGGSFSAYSDSIASPFGRWTDSLSIR